MTSLPPATIAIIFLGGGALLLALVLVLSWCVRPLRQRKAAQETYECGMVAEGDPRGIGFEYLNYAVLFLVFDLGALYLFLFAALPSPTLEQAGALTVGLLVLTVLILASTRERRTHAS